MTDAFEAAKPLYDALIAKHPGIERKGAKSAYTSIHGNMFSFLTDEGALALRMSKEDQEFYTRTHGVGPSIQYGSVMRDYVEFPPELLANRRLMTRAFAKCVEYAATLPPKATTKKKAGKRAQKKLSKKKVAKKKVAKRKATKKR